MTAYDADRLFQPIIIINSLGIPRLAHIAGHQVRNESNV